MRHAPHTHVRALTTLLCALVALLAYAPDARADCTNSPAECCITDVAHVTAPMPEHVRLGVRLLRVDHVSERDGSFNADVFVLTRWPSGGLRPDLDVRNAGETANVVDDRTLLDRGFCYHTRRLLDSFEMSFRLRRFPFDRQNLRIVLEDDEWTPAQVVYEPELWPRELTIDAYRQLTSWRMTDHPAMTEVLASYAFTPDNYHPRRMVIELPVVREWQFYLTRYFLPLLLIVALAYSLFWIKPDDLGSASSIGMTCVLSIIAFQLTQADTLPHVPYLTLADRVYVVCYIATSAALVIAVTAAYLAHNDRLPRAKVLHRRARVLYPTLFFAAAIVASVTGWYAHRDPHDEQLETLPDPTPPPGEHVW